MPHVLSELQLKRLTEHKYSATGSSILEPLMQKFWRWIVEQIPLWWAPNAITLTGLFCNVATTIILCYYSPDIQGKPPAWAFLLCASGLFMYQVLDAIDGKQARRTNSSSPLGELFDHGCDSVSTVFVVLGCCIAVQLGKHPSFVFIEVFTTIFLFYAAHWQTYVTGTMKFGKLDVTEAQISIITIHILTAIFGIEIWDTPVPVIGELRFAPVYFSIFTAILASRLYFGTIFIQGGAGKNGSTIAGTSTLFPALPIATVVILALIISYKSASNLFETHTTLYCVSFGIVAAKVINKLVVAHMTKSEMDLLDPCLTGPSLLFLNQYFNMLFNEHIVLWLACIIAILDLFTWSRKVCLDICEFLGIYCFSIRPLQSGNNGYEPPVTRSKTKERDH
ncbi:DgyrCDS9436 [Dimorphilus gyrociliatus]|uniref:diacylglycerol cholinephosphotransferase n=1 Tax=Dimorphilus gyrociliatus TaxID=2664684 RepID=A0A7I8VYN2_9ANNE|nr:DgyrCDS9436 [Dimorphilus gyrociliatus]